MKKLILYYSWMDTDIDKWCHITSEKPEKEKGDWFWDFYQFEVTSIYDFIERFDGKMLEIDNIDEILLDIVLYFG